MVGRNVNRLHDLREAAHSFERWEDLAGEGLHACYAMPFVARGSALGVLGIFHRGRHDADQELVELLENRAGQAAIALNNTAVLEASQRSNSDLARAYDATIEGRPPALDVRDHENEGQAQRVTEAIFAP